MKSILEEFARGNISPEPRTFKRDSHYGRAIQVVSDYEEKLLAVLSEQDKDMLIKLSDAQAALSLLSGIDKFIYGYRLGVLMTTEVFNGRESLMVSTED